MGKDFDALAMRKGATSTSLFSPLRASSDDCLNLLQNC